jgi:hypothetical protein
MVAVGIFELAVTISCADEVQPFEPVTVKLYVAGEPMVTVEALPKPLSQLNVPFPFAVTVMVGCVQVRMVVPLLLVIVAVGGVMFLVILMEDVEEHPFVPVTVTV